MGGFGASATTSGAMQSKVDELQKEINELRKLL